MITITELAMESRHELQDRIVKLEAENKKLELDLETSKKMHGVANNTILGNLVENKHLRDVLVELDNLLYIDSDGIGNLDTARKIIIDALKDGIGCPEE